MKTLTLSSMLMLLSALAFAHDEQHAGMSGEWIGKLALKDPIWKYSCCGNNDCASLPEGSVVDRIQGVFLHETGEVIPQSRVIRMATPDGYWWRCRFTHGHSHPGKNPADPEVYRKVNDTRCLIGPAHGS